MSQPQDSPGLKPFGRPWNLDALRQAYPRWLITLHDLTRVMAVLREDPSVSATPEPVTVAVMGCTLAWWHAEDGRPARGY